MTTFDLAQTWSQDQVAKLDEASRDVYEGECEFAEQALMEGRTYAEIADVVVSSQGIVRTLVLLHVTKCIFESECESQTLKQLSDKIDKFEAISTHLNARQELIAFAKSLLPDRADFEIPETHEFVAKVCSTPLSNVMIVRRKSLDRQECLKVVMKEQSVHPELLQMIEAEAEKAAKLSHPGLVEVYDAIPSETHLAIFMEFMNGGTLADRKNEGPLPWQMVIKHIAVVARALAAMHQIGIAHGDLKPSNLFFHRLSDGSENLKIGDFGLASNFIFDVRNDSIALGTPGYIAPELLERKNKTDFVELDERATADVFSLGVTAYEAITGRLPYQTEQESPDAFGVLNNPYVCISEFVPEVPKVVAYTIRRACAIKRQDRFVSAREFAKALERCYTEGIGTTTSSQTIDLSHATDFTHATAPAKTTRSTWNTYQIAIVSLVTIFLLVIGSQVLQIWSEPEAQQSFVEDKEALIRFESNRDRPLEDEKPIPANMMPSVFELNEDFLAALGAQPETIGLRDRAESILSDNFLDIVGQDTIERWPHLMPVVNYPSVQEAPEIYSRLDSRIEQQGVVNLFVQNPFPETSRDSLRAWAANYNAISSLMKTGLFGAEQFFSDETNDELYRMFAGDLLVERVSNRPGQFDLWVLIFLEQNENLVTRLGDSSFRQRFPDTWRQFLQLIDEDETLASEFAMNGYAWDFLALPGAVEVIRKYRLLMVSCFFGNDSFPSDDSTRNAVMAYLRLGYDPIVRSFLDPTIRTSPEFCLILKRDLPAEVFASICQNTLRLKQEGSSPSEYLQSTANKTKGHLVADHEGVDINRWTAETFVPQLIYLRLTLKAVQGQSLYDVEKQALVRRLAIDAVTYGVPYANSLAGSRGFAKSQVDGFVQAFPGGFDAGQRAVKDLVQKDQLKALIEFDAQQAEDSTVGTRMREQLRVQVKEIKRLTNAVGGQTTDISNGRLLFSSLAVPNEKIKQIDLSKVRLIRLPDGTIFPEVRTNSGVFRHQKIREFFAGRSKTILSSDIREESRQKAIEQLISAWLILGILDEIPYQADGI